MKIKTFLAYCVSIIFALLFLITFSMKIYYESTMLFLLSSFWYVVAETWNCIDEYVEGDRIVYDNAMFVMNELKEEIMRMKEK